MEMFQYYHVSTSVYQYFIYALNPNENFFSIFLYMFSNIVHLFGYCPLLEGGSCVCMSLSRTGPLTRISITSLTVTLSIQKHFSVSLSTQKHFPVSLSIQKHFPLASIGADFLRKMICISPLGASIRFVYAFTRSRYLH